MFVLFRDYNDRRENNHHQQRQRHYESEESDGGSNYGNEQPNNKVIVRGLPAHITEADVSDQLSSIFRSFKVFY